MSYCPFVCFIENVRKCSPRQWFGRLPFYLWPEGDVLLKFLNDGMYDEVKNLLNDSRVYFKYILES